MHRQLWMCPGSDILETFFRLETTRNYSARWYNWSWTTALKHTIWRREAALVFISHYHLPWTETRMFYAIKTSGTSLFFLESVHDYILAFVLASGNTCHSECNQSLIREAIYSLYRMFVMQERFGLGFCGSHKCWNYFHHNLKSHLYLYTRNMH